METLYLVQHGQSQHHVNPEARLWPDPRNGLTDLGRDQARRVAVRLSQEVEHQPVPVYTSPMQRAAETAGIIAGTLQTTLQTMHDLHEFNGRFALERTENGGRWPIDKSDWSLFDWRPFPEAETWREFFTRVAEAMDRISTEFEEEPRCICVVHGGTLSNIIVWWLDIPLDDLPERTCFAASPGSLSVLKRNRYGNPVLECLNDRAHLA
jgi:probable phosphoglycerate mutase